MRTRLLSAKVLVGTIAALALASCTSLDPDIVHHRAEGALGPYSAAVETGSLLFVSGKIGERGQSFAHEATTAMDAVRAELERHGARFADVVTATVFLTDMERYAEFNEIYATYFTAPRYPARACVAVAALPAGARVEVQVVAKR